jgi:mannan endo-1,4-beta-mannosidase
MLDGRTYQPVSVNAYELATDWGINAGCGAMLDDAALHSFFAGLPSGATVRIWGFQGAMATNVVTGARDWGPLDRVVAAAAAAGDHLIVSLGNEWGVCDDGVYKDLSWYLSGYRDVAAGNGYDIPTESYWGWVQDVVSRYAASTTIAMWELINEPEAPQCAPGYASPCPGHLVCNESASAAALRSFYDVVGAEVKRLDPNHLVESGSGGGQQCGWAGGDFATVSASPGIDVASFHDYEGGVLPSDFNNRLPQAAALGKPLLVGEVGLEGGDVAGCASLGARAAQAAAKIDAMLGAGAAGMFFWDWVPNPQTSACTLDVGSSDPIMTLLRT